MITTRIKLTDGIEYDGRHIAELTLRPFLAADYDYFNFGGTMRGAINMLARLSGEPFDALAVLTMDDMHDAILAMGEHVDKHQRTMRRR